jgi:hypothetical protein
MTKGERMGVDLSCNAKALRDQLPVVADEPPKAIFYRLSSPNFPLLALLLCAQENKR